MARFCILKVGGYGIPAADATGKTPVYFARFP
jgi:hypothetical protein